MKTLFGRCRFVVVLSLLWIVPLVVSVVSLAVRMRRPCSVCASLSKLYAVRVLSRFKFRTKLKNQGCIQGRPSSPLQSKTSSLHPCFDVQACVSCPRVLPVILIPASLPLLYILDAPLTPHYVGVLRPARAADSRTPPAFFSRRFVSYFANGYQIL